MKAQMKFQKILTLCCLIFSAAVIVLSFFFCSGMLYEIKFYLGLPGTGTYVEGAQELYDYSQWVNNKLTILAIILLCCVLLLYIASCNKRRNYYITNYVAVGITVVYSVICAILFLAFSGKTLSLCASVDVAAWKAHLEAGAVEQHFSTNKATLVLCILVAVMMLVMAAAWVLNTLWKVMLMKGEKALLENNKEVANNEIG